MAALLGLPGRARRPPRQQAGSETLAIPRPQVTAFQQCSPLESGNIVGGAIIRLIGAVLLEQNDEWQLQHRYMQVEGMAGLVPPTIDGEATPLPSAQTTPKAA